MAQAKERPFVGELNNRRFQECPFATEKCQKCGGTGHIARACKGQVPQKVPQKQEKCQVPQKVPQKQEKSVSYSLHQDSSIVYSTGYGKGHGSYFNDEVTLDQERALDACFEETGKNSSVNTQTTDTTASATATSSGEPVDPEPNRIRLLTWNTDGIDENDVLERAEAVAKIIVLEKPDVVFLQEVVEETAEIYEKHCPQYEYVAGGREKYFVAMLLRKSSVVLKGGSIIQFPATRMRRNLLTAKATVKGVQMELLTSHLESMSGYGEERKWQLQKGFEEVTNAQPQSTVIFGGDLNLRDKELAALGGVPEGLYDLWEVTGRRHHARYTWDTLKNDNLDTEEWEFKPRLRFDRLYLRHPTSGPNKLKPVHFELVGIQRLTSCERFPSDHWGILSHYDKVNS